MENLKLISIRLDPDLLKKIDEMAAKQSYRKRSNIIQNVLKNVIECATTGTLWKIVDTWFAYEKGYKIEFKVDPEALKQRSEAKE